VLPADQVKALKAELKEANAQVKLAKREGRKDDCDSQTKKAAGIEQRLARHKVLEEEVRRLNGDLRANEKKQEVLVVAAREKIDGDEARRVILDRLHRLLVQTYQSYLHACQRECQQVLENLHAKYSISAKVLERSKAEAGAKLKAFLVELGYE